MEKGLLFIVFGKLIDFLKKLNAVEWCKHLALKFSNTTDEKFHRRAAVDIFIIFKFAVASLAFIFPNTFLVCIVVYLCFFNAFTYFYYHVWCPPEDKTLDALRRRFLNLFLSLGFNMLSFATLYKFIGVPLVVEGSSGYFILSLMNTFMMGTDYLAQGALETHFYRSIFISQALLSFTFLTLVLSNTEIKQD